ncbi:MAG: UDP-glucose 4-epimerase GalE [Phycisphaerae bacterium]|nr:UDP-glucose 4-epimerase GalE [Phycisphaerae bacterium]
MNVLLTGGAGYIGSHVARAVAASGHTPVIYDNLSKGHRTAVGGFAFVEADVGDAGTLTAALRDHAIDTVIHLAALAEAGESVEHPDRYFRNNTAVGLALLDAMRCADVSRLVFSSTAAVYGNVDRMPIREGDPLAPINPYGASKLCVEFMLRAYAKAYDMGFVSLRYFNVAGADPAGDIGEDHDPETHLIPLVLQVALGQREQVAIYGDDYDTSDGTCIRDYIHVCDLSDAHVLAADAIEPGRVKVCNLGNGEGFSVHQVIATCRKVTGANIPAEVAPRRPGDPPRLVASSVRAADELAWRPQRTHLETIVTDAWRWHRGHPDGYGDR